MSNPRQEYKFTVGAQDYNRRPTFDAVAKIEARWGALPRVLIRMGSGDFGMSDTADLAGVVLGSMREGGPSPEAIKQAVFDDYSGWLKALSSFIDGALYAPAKEGTNPQ